MTNNMKLGAFLMYPVHIVVVNSSMEIKRTLRTIHNDHTLVSLLSVKHREDSITVQRIYEPDGSWKGTNNVTSELFPSENLIV